MMRLLKKIPFFLILLALFFCLHGSVENYGYLNPGEVVWLGLVIMFWITALFLVIRLFSRNYIFSALTCFFISCWYLFFGAIHDWIKTVHALSFISSYSVLLPLLLACTVLFILLLKRNRAIAARLCFFLNILLLIYCLVDSAMLLNKQLTPHKKITNAVHFDDSIVTAKPNVYFLLFDEYPGYKSLRDSFAFANDSLYSFLAKKDFEILPLYSNYDFTPFSMSSILNMQYVDPGYDHQKVSQHDLQVRINEIRNGEVFGIFKKMGYRIQNYSVFDIGDEPGIASQNSFLPMHLLLLTDKVLHNRIIRTTGWLFQTGKLALPIWKKKYLYEHETNNLYAQKMLTSSTPEKTSGPKFCYAHFMLPHWPFYRDSTGAPNSETIIADRGHVNDKALFLSYVKYTNTVIGSIIKEIRGNDPGALVILMSDHGYRNYGNTIPYEPFNFDNICAVHFPGNLYPGYKESWSTVNLFRYIFNVQYGQQLPYLKDSSIVLSY